MRHRGFKTLAIQAMILALFSWLAAEAVCAKEPGKYLHQIWQVEDGMPSPMARSILQTHDGYLWVATQDGLVRFDGLRFATPLDIKQDGEVEKERQYFALAETRDGSLWASTARGLIRWQDGNATYYSTNNGLPSSYIITVYQDKKGTIWIGSTTGLSRFEDGKFIRYREKDGYFEDSVRSVLEDHNGVLWVGSAIGLVRVKDGHAEKLTRANAPDLLPNSSIQCLYETRAGDLWIATSGGVSWIHEGVCQQFTTGDQHGLGHNTVRAIYEDASGTIWIGGFGGVQQFVDGKFMPITITGEMATDFGNLVPGYVYSITDDHEGNVWIGTSAGLNRIKKQTFETFSKGEGLLNIVTTSVLETREGEIWVGTWGGGVSQFHDGKIINRTVHDGLAHNFVLALCQDREGSLWIGTDNGGLNRFQNGKFTLFTTNNSHGLADNVIKVIYEDKKGALWIGGPNGLSRYQNGAFTNFSKAQGLAITTIKSILEDKNGDLWVGAKEGLTCFKAVGGFKYYTANEGFPPEMVNALYEDADGAIWIGTELGRLVRFKNGQFTHYDKATKGLFNRILHILEDDAGSIWMSSQRGIFRLNKKELNDYASHLTTNITSVSYGRLDGMRRAQCNGIAQPSGWKAKDGNLWFPTLAGVVAVDIKNIELNTNPPPVVIEQVLLNGKPFSFKTKEKAAIPSGRSELEFQYTALSFQVPEKVLFRTQLEGTDHKWTEVSGKRTVRYVNLVPGEYKFQVTACNNEGLWNEIGAAFAFSISPHFYETYSFYAFCAVGAAFIGWTMYQLRVRHLQQRQVELVKIVDDRTKSLQQEIVERKETQQALLESQQMVLRQERLAAVGQLSAGVAHEFNNILTVIQGHTAFLLENPALDDESTKSLKHISAGVERTAKLTQQMLAFSRKQIMQQQILSLNQVISHVIKMLGRILGENIMLRCHFDPQLPTVRADPGMIEQIIMNLAVNARDAMIKGGDLIIRTQSVHIAKLDSRAHAEARAGHFICLSVSDTGCGMDNTTINRIFEPFFTTKGVGKGTGLGLSTVYGIVKRHQGWIEVASTVGQGTTFKIYFPASGKTADLPIEKAPVLHTRGGQETILLVEDEDILRELVCEILEGQGYQVLSAGSGAEALAVWERNGRKIDLLLTDIVMPEGMSGRELAEKMQETNPRLPIIYSSGYSQEMMESGGPERRKGVAYLSKPYHPGQLTQVVRECLDAVKPLVEA